MIPFGIAACGFVGQPLTEQLYAHLLLFPLFQNESSIVQNLPCENEFDLCRWKAFSHEGLCTNTHFDKEAKGYLN